MKKIIITISLVLLTATSAQAMSIQESTEGLKKEIAQFGKAELMKLLVDSTAESLPMRLDKNTMLIGINYALDTLVYRFQLTGEVSRAYPIEGEDSQKALVSRIKNNAINYLCTTPGTRGIINNDVSYKYIYTLKNGTFVSSTTVDATVCENR